jgi:hypothetical protein
LALSALQANADRIRRIGASGLTALIGFAVSACAPPTLCDRLAGDETTVIEAFFGFVSEQDLTPEEIEALTLSTIPGDLQYVLDNRATFELSDHPLRNVLPGTVLEPLDALNGCWGRVETESLGDDGSFIWVVAEAWRIDLDAETLDEHIIKGLDGTPCFSDDRPIVQSFQDTTLQTGSQRVTVRTDNGLAAGLDDDGGLSRHELGTVGAALSIERERFFYFSVQTDYLVTSEEQYNPEEPLVDDLDFWVRFPCPQ